MKFKVTEKSLYKLFDGNPDIGWDDIFDVELEGELVDEHKGCDCILEKPKKIEEIKDEDRSDWFSVVLRDKINELIKYINEG